MRCIMKKLTFNDLLIKNNISPNDVLYIRHAFNNSGFKSCLKTGHIHDYTCHQKRDFSNGRSYWAVFIGEKEYTARFYRFYKVNGVKTSKPSLASKDFPHPEWLKSGVFYDLEECDIFKEYYDKITVNWSGVRSFHNKAENNDKEIISIKEKTEIAFPGYDNLIITYDELQKIVYEEEIYSHYHTALSSINAIYLIVDLESGKQYVGSSYGKNGLLERWKCYVDTKHGNNKKMKELIVNIPDRFHSFQFSILKILSPSVTADEAIEYERMYKKKLLPKQFGLNDN